jgi:O-antigen/teichoic acid export membrane protein
MSITKRIAFGAAASWFSRGVSILLGLVLLPVLFRHLPKEELGVWLLLGQSWAALGIFDLGFGATLTRRIAFAKGKSGSDPGAALTDETLREIADLVATGKRVYRALAVFAFVFSLSAGFFYLRTLHLGAVPFSQVWLAWSVICLSQALGVWANVWNCILLGVGYVGWDAVLGSLASALTLLAQIIVVFFGGGLVALAVVAAAGALTQRFLMLGFARSRRPEIFAIRGQWNFSLVKGMTPLALRAWATALGAVLVLNTDQILIASMRGTAAVPAYRAAFVLIHNLTVVAVTLGLASSVFISHLWQAGEIKNVHRIVERNVRLGWLTMLTGSACLLVIGRQLFELWLGPGNFIGFAVIGAFLVTETLETQSYIIATASRATEDEAFAFSAVAGGVLKLTLSWLFARQFGLLGIAMGTVVGLLLTNHWYMVYRGLRRLKISLREYVKTILLPCGLVFPVMLGGLWGVRSLCHETAPIVQLASVSLTALLMFGGAVWLLVLEPGQRARVGRALGRNKNNALT